MEVNEFSEIFPRLTRRLGVEDASRFISGLRVREVPTGTMLIGDQTPIASFYFILQGEFQVVVPHPSGELEIGRMGPGKLIGEATLFSVDHQSRSRVTAISYSRVFEIPHGQYWLWWKDNPDLASVLTREFIDQMSERVRASDELINHGVQKTAVVSQLSS